MGVAGLSHERDGRPGAARRPSSARDRRRPHVRVVRPESPHVGQGPSKSAPAVDRPTGDVDPAAAPDLADQLQADYFKRMLVQRRSLVDRRIDDHQKAIASAESRGDAEAACGLRRLARAEEQDRQTLDDLIEKLRRRFPHQAQAGTPTHTRRPRSMAR